EGEKAGMDKAPDGLARLRFRFPNRIERVLQFREDARRPGQQHDDPQPTQPASGRLALSSIALTAWLPSAPTRFCIWRRIWLRATSRPKTRPRTPITTSNNGASEKME